MSPLVPRIAFWSLLASALPAQTIRVGLLHDGVGGVRRRVDVDVVNGRIGAIRPWAAGRRVAWDFSNGTLLPGFIDTHIHAESHFGRDGRASTQGETPAQRLWAAVDNLYLTQRAGFTTVQSLGAPIDSTLRRMSAQGDIRAPRVLTSLGSLSDTTLSPDAVREWARRTVAAGADVLKIFASRSIRDGGGQTMTDAQIAAACTEARALGKPIWVHAHAASAVRAAAQASCWAVTHGSQVTDAELRLMAERGTWFEPNIGLVSQNYIENKPRYLGIGNYDEAGFRQMEEGIQRKLVMFRRAIRVPGLRLIMGTDATAGAHAQNARETIYRVQVAGQSAPEALRTLTSVNAQALGLQDSVGAIRTGLVADLVVVAGDPARDIAALHRVQFVMRAGMVVRAPSWAFAPGDSSTRLPAPSMTTALADFDLDGDVDAYVGMNGRPSRLLRSDGGRFVDVAASLGLSDARPVRAAAWGDYDGDGDPDLFLGLAPGGGSVTRLMRNDGVRFTDVTRDAGLVRDSGAVRQPVFVDVDGDGDLDLFVAWRDRANTLFRNDGGRYTDIAADIGLADARRTVGAVWFDYDQDGDLDLVTGNMDGDANGLFRNDRGRFTDVAEAAGMAWGGRPPRLATAGTVRPCVADLDADGDLDLVMANYGKPGVFLNRGDGRFEDVSPIWGTAVDGRYDTCALGDADNDGRVDLYLNGTVTGGINYRDFLYQNTGSTFVDVTPDSIGAQQGDHGAAWFDADGDGDLDLFLNGGAEDGMQGLWRNGLPARDRRRSLRVIPADSAGRIHPGSEVRFFSARSSVPWATILVDAGSGYDAQSVLPVAVGVPTGVTNVRVELVVPAGGVRRVVRRWTLPFGVSPGAAPLVLK